MAFLQAEKGALESAIKTVHGILERASFEYRLEEVLEEIAGLEVTEEKAGAEIRLVFHGGPVVDAIGIEVGFVADALSKFQDLVAKAAVPLESMAASGPIRASHLSRLHVTDLVRGSFGFELRELAPTETSTLAATVDESARLIEAVGNSDDEAFVETIANFHPRVQTALASFFKTISDADATFELSTSSLVAAFPKERVSAATARLARNERLEDTTLVEDGTLFGVLPKSRQFEFVEPRSGEVWKGKIARESDAAEIAKLANTQVRATFRVSRWRRNDRVVQRHTLVGVEAIPS